MKLGRVLVAAVAIVACMGTAGAIEIYWDKGSTDITSPVGPPYPGDGLWISGVNWRANGDADQTNPPNDVAPGAGDRANIALHNNWSEIDAPCTIETGDSITISSIRLGSNPGLGVGGHGKLIMNGGSLTLKDVDTGAHFLIGADNNRTGEFTMNGGTLLIDDVGRRIVLGNGANTATHGIVDFQGGTITSKGGLFIAGDDANANRQNTRGDFTMGTLGDALTDQILTTTGSNLEVGLGGTGTFTQNSGTVSVDSSNLIVSQGTQANDTYTMNGGLLDVENQIRVGNKGVGKFIQHGGTVNVGTTLDLANDVSNDADATYTMLGGVLNVADRTNNHLKIGNADRAGSKALFELIAGDVDVSANVRIADNGASSSGNLVIGNGTTTPTLTCNHFETADNGTGMVEMYSGTLTLDGGNLIVGQAAGSNATFTIEGGVIDLRPANAANSTHGYLRTNTGIGEFNLNGGQVFVGHSLDLANNAAGGLTVNVDGGDMIIRNHINYRGGGTDAINLKSGLIDLTGGNVNFANATDEFNFTGGVLQDCLNFGRSMTNAGGTLRPGGSTGDTNIAGSYMQEAAAALEIEIAGAADNDFVSVRDTAVLGGTLKVVLDGYTPTMSDQWVILQAGTLGPQTFNALDTSMAPLPVDDWYWVVDYDVENGTVILQVAPEPATMTLLALGGLGLAIRRRRRR